MIYDIAYGIAGFIVVFLVWSVYYYAFKKDKHFKKSVSEFDKIRKIKEEMERRYEES